MRASRLIIPALVFALLPACSNQGPKVAVVSNNPEDFWTFCEAGAKQAGKDVGIEVIFRKPEKGDATVQRGIINDLVSQGVKGISVSVIDPANQVNELKQVAQQTKLVTMDNDAEGSGRICYIGTDNYTAGREVGRLVKQAMPGGGEVAIFVGQESPLNARQRFWGVIDELADAPGSRTDFPKPEVKGDAGKYKIFHNAAITDGADRVQAQTNAKQALTEIGTKPNVCFVGLWAYNPPAILTAVRADAAYKNVKIVGFDEDFATLDAIDKGEIFATVVQNPYQFGYQSVVVLAAESRGDTSKRVTQPIAHRVVTKDGGPDKEKQLKASEYSAELKRLLAAK